MKNGDVASTFQATNTMPNMSPADVVADGMFSAGQNGLTWLADGSAQLWSAVHASDFQFV